MTTQLPLSKERIFSLCNNLFLLLLGAYLVLGTLRTTSLEYTHLPFFSAAIAAGLALVILVKFVFLHTYSIQEALLYTILFVIVLVVVLRNHHDTLMMLFLLIIAAKGVDFHKIVLIQLIAVTEVLLFSAVLSQTGISADYGATHFGGILKTYGVCNTTDFASYILFLVFGYTFLRGTNISFVELSLFVAGFFWIYKKTHARTAFFSLLLFCFVVVVYKLTIYFSFDPKKLIKEPVGTLIMPVLSLLMLVMSFFYSTSSVLLVKFDRILTNRIMLGHTGLERYGIHLLGNEVIEHGYGFKENPVSYFFIDSSYMRLFLIDGLLIYCIVMLIYCSIYKKFICKENFVGVAIFFIIAIISFTEQHLLEPWYNPFTILCLAQLNSQKGNNLHESSGNGFYA